MEIRNIFSDQVHVKVNCKKPGRTKPEFKESCDINHILSRYVNTGQIPIHQKPPLYGDFSEVKDYRESLNLLIEAENNFNDLPSKIRKRFDNDPAKFLEFMDNPDNEAEMRELGILPPVDVATEKEIDSAEEEPSEASADA